MGRVFILYLGFKNSTWNMGKGQNKGHIWMDMYMAKKGESVYLQANHHGNKI